MTAAEGDRRSRDPENEVRSKMSWWGSLR